MKIAVYNRRANDVLVSARKICQEARFTLCDANSNHSLGNDLIGQTRMLDLELA